MSCTWTHSARRCDKSEEKLFDQDLVRREKWRHLQTWPKEQGGPEEEEVVVVVVVLLAAYKK